MTSYLITGASILGGEPSDVWIRDGVVSTTGATDAGEDVETIDATGLIALPGLVDLHTHLREPGREDAETVLTGTQAAAMGGFTAVHAMANTDPVADTAGVVEQVTNGVAVRMAVLYLLLGGSEPAVGTAEPAVESFDTPAGRAPQEPPFETPAGRAPQEPPVETTEA